jgi:hypothetical protein
MFSRFARPLWRRFFTPRKLLTTTALLAYSIFKTHTLLDSAPEQPEVAALSDFPVEEGGESPKQINEYIKKLQFLDVCEGQGPADHNYSIERQIVRYFGFMPTPRAI